MQRVKSLVPGRVRAFLGTGVSALLRLRRYPEARRILRGYAAHYGEAQRIFRADGNAVEPAFASIRDVGVRVVMPGAKRNVLELPDNYPDLLNRMRADVRERMAWSANCRFFPALDPRLTPDRTDAVLDMTKGDTLTIHLREYLNINGLEELCAQVMPQVERTIYGSYAAVDKVYVYRSLVSHQPPQVSLVWHFDEHPREMLKIMIYLTDVDEGTAPFTYLRSAGSSEALIGARMPIGGYSRISDLRIAAYVAKGFAIRPVTGPRGTMILFHDNVIHRGTLATRSHRDVIVLQLRPSCFRCRPYIDSRWTGSFQHESVNHDPWVMAPELESSEAS